MNISSSVSFVDQLETVQPKHQVHFIHIKASTHSQGFTRVLQVVFCLFWPFFSQSKWTFSILYFVYYHHHHERHHLPPVHQYQRLKIGLVRQSEAAIEIFKFLTTSSFTTTADFQFSFVLTFLYIFLSSTPQSKKENEREAKQNCYDKLSA